MQTYEVELEMQASGVPKVGIKKRDASPWSEAEPPRRAQSVPPALSVPRGSKSCKPETTYMSPPCLRPSHSSPSKSGGQTYICQSCTPSTPSPFQTDVGVPWTPSPKHSGKTTPDRIKDWPRRKRVVLRSLGATTGRGDAGSDLPVGGSLLRLEGKEPGLELSISRSPFLGDFELEGVCQLPDQSPTGDSEWKVEEAFSWGQFGLGPRKRLLSTEEEVDCEAKRVCDMLRGDWEVGQSEERSPRMGVQQIPATGVNEALVSGKSADLTWLGGWEELLLEESWAPCGAPAGSADHVPSFHRFSPAARLCPTQLPVCQRAPGANPVPSAVPREDGLLAAQRRHR